MTSGPPARDAGYFDQWYADMAACPARDAIVARTLGLPPELQFASALTWEALDEITRELRLPPGGLVLDLGCGRGGYGIEVALRAGARLAGVDFSAVALEQARAIAGRRLPEGRAGFRVGTLTASGLPDGVADGVMCVDAVQFAEPPVAALREVRRVLTGGGRVVLTCWEAADPADERVPARIRAVDLRRDLPAAGFVDVRVEDRPGWRRAERALWEAAVAADDPDPAVGSLRDEGRRSLESFGSLRRVVATATAP
ncbi:methyltransferase domain-containing protein [Couchioplanes caeruleus]|uniref:class I SAM-dependent methyltransferase n=1 Tax=Couchioplanes caeruleus TaxID=56438 RepID=UPI00201BF990|nr:class I SAM-dependent methyltransferase [Couchioplanes caeruleus]UQU61352.1 methyltransferase domain-containing protein [Couchioplanes caeruleus]